MQRVATPGSIANMTINAMQRKQSKIGSICSFVKKNLNIRVTWVTDFN